MTAAVTIAPALTLAATTDTTVVTVAPAATVPAAAVVAAAAPAAPPAPPAAPPAPPPAAPPPPPPAPTPGFGISAARPRIGAKPTPRMAVIRCPLRMVTDCRVTTSVTCSTPSLRECVLWFGLGTSSVPSVPRIAATAVGVCSVVVVPVTL